MVRQRWPSRRPSQAPSSAHSQHRDRDPHSRTYTQTAQQECRTALGHGCSLMFLAEMSNHHVPPGIATHRSPRKRASPVAVWFPVMSIDHSCGTVKHRSHESVVCGSSSRAVDCERPASEYLPQTRGFRGYVESVTAQRKFSRNGLRSRRDKRPYIDGLSSADRRCGLRGFCATTVSRSCRSRLADTKRSGACACRSASTSITAVAAWQRRGRCARGCQRDRARHERRSRCARGLRLRDRFVQVGLLEVPRDVDDHEV